MDKGIIDWEIMKTLGSNYSILPGSSLDIVTTQSEVFHLIVLHNPSDSTSDSILEVRVDNDYHQNLMPIAILLSLPSLWMTAFVVYRLVRLKKNNRSMIDSSPSHIWEDE